MKELKFRGYYPSGEPGTRMREVVSMRLMKKETRFRGELEGGGFSYELMQFTGLRDKRGKEIYEGDIFRSMDRLWEMAWYSMGAQFVPASIEVIAHSGHISRGAPLRDFNYLDQGKNGIYLHKTQSKHAIEVIGNIHENPELLNG